MTPKYTIRAETSAEVDAVNQMQGRAFEGEDIIPVLMDDLRALNGALPTQSLVACDENNQIIGNVMLSHSWLDDDKAMVDVYVLSPLGIAPEYQGQGIGKALIKAAIDAARESGAPLLFLEGNPKYYRGSGFVAAGTLGFRRPSTRIPEFAFQVIALNEDAKDLGGTLIYREPFWARDCVGLR